MSNLWNYDAHGWSYISKSDAVKAVEALDRVAGERVMVKSRKADLVLWRAVLFTYMRLHGMPYMVISWTFKKNHTTILSSVRNARYYEKYPKTCPMYAEYMERFKKELDNVGGIEFLQIKGREKW